MTTDLGFAHLRLADDFIVGFVDVPGHGKFLKNMLAGVGGIDIALLVVAADEGPMPQTRQHVRILSLLGVDKAIVAMTKIDMVSDKDHIEIVEEEIKNLLLQHGITLLQLVPVSSTKNIGLQELQSALREHLSKLPARDTTHGSFLPVDRVFSKAGFGTIITGTLVRGKLSTGDQVTIGPGVSGARVRRLESFGQTVEFAQPGQRVACNVVLKDNKTISRGHVVLGHEVPDTRLIVASIIDRPKLIGEKFSERISNQPVRLYHGTAECHGYLRWAETIDAAGAASENEATHDASTDTMNQAVALIALDEPLMVQAQDRFVLRMSDETIYGGIVLLRDKPKWMKRADILSVSSRILAGDYKTATMSLMDATPQHIARQSQVSLLLPAPSDRQIIEELTSLRNAITLGDSIMAIPIRESLSKNLVDTVTKLIKERVDGVSEGDGISLETVRSYLNPKLERATFQCLVEEEERAGKIVRKGDKLQLAGAEAPKSVDPAVLKLQQQIASALEENFCMDLEELARACKSETNKIKAVVTNLSKQTGQVSLIGHEFVISAANLHKAHQALADIWNTKRNISPADFKDKLNLTRKYAMPLLQHFDDQKITRRLTDGRVLLKAPPASG